MNTKENDVVKKLSTGITGFDAIANGGLPKGRTTLLSGTAGSCKTVFAIQFLANGIKHYDENCVFVTFEEPPEDIRKNMMSFGWDIQKWEKQNSWRFVDVAPKPEDQSIISGNFDLGALLARIEHAVKQVNATRVSIDSLGAIFSKFDDHQMIRVELLQIAIKLKALGVTSLMTAERIDEYGEIARYGIEEFVADNVIILRNVLESENRRRTMEILKFRGTDHQKGEHPFTIVGDGGIVGVPLSSVSLDHRSSNIRTSSGSHRLDEMCGGGFFRDSIVLISGATGAGKTLISTNFIGGAPEGERAIFFAFEESRDQLIRNAEGWGVDFARLEAAGRLKIICAYPETTGLEQHLIGMKRAIEEFRPSRIAVDSLSALERGASPKSFREFVIGLTSFVKQQEIVGVFTSVTPALIGATSITGAHISMITDSIILLRYVELFGEISRGIAVLKMRGSFHEKQIRQFTIDDMGMSIGQPFRNITGILSGNPQYHVPEEMDRLKDMFESV
ncbi:MAG: circadian clock protein KaiC [Granulosicoccus sp.]|nr:circadian clock protein KaiC [Granulosicoccus sp.]